MTLAVVLAVAPPAAALLLVATMPSFGLFRWLIRENSVIESLQLAALVGTAALLAWVALRIVAGGRRLRWAYLLFALATVFVAGEETSWGQTLVGSERSNWFTRESFQGETNLHTGVAHGVTVWGFVLISLYGSLVPLLTNRLGERRTPLMYLLVPPLALVPAFAISFVYRFVRAVFDPVERIPRYAFQIDRFSEFAELSLYFALLMIALLTWRLHADVTPVQAVGPTGRRS